MQIAAAILAYGDKNRRLKRSGPPENHVVYAVRVLATHVTFYKAEIPAAYWEELDKGLPVNQSVEILRWPAKNSKNSGYDLAEPDDRRHVFTALVKIREDLRRERHCYGKTPDTVLRRP